MSRAPRNRTLVLNDDESERLAQHLVESSSLADSGHVDQVIWGDAHEILASLPHDEFDLLIADPPYNLTKIFGSERFKARASDDYEEWLNTWLKLAAPLLRSTASVYICGDWRSSAAVQRVGERYFKLRNRITWEREKGRGSDSNWKNVSEDIWFFTVSDDHTFNVGEVKTRRRVLAPYREAGKPKDWVEEGRFRDTHPSNLWTDITVPFWSMPENTEHPTQKPEKLLAKMILASTSKGDKILDPFGGSGTTAVAAKKLDRHFTVIEADRKYCLLAKKRLEIADSNGSIQGFEDGVFWERNARPRRS